MIGILPTILRWGWEMLLPPVCCSCGRQAFGDGVLCAPCRQAATENPSRPLCPQGLSQIACGPELGPPLRALVHALKYSGVRAAAAELVDLARPAVPSDFFPPQAVLVPVPLHSHRARERGYNQSALLARRWAESFGRRVELDWLRRVRETPTQTKLSASERAANLRNAFEVTAGYRPGVPVVLVDDVLTTGSTLTSCAAKLLAAGAPSVHGLCVAWAGEA